MIHVFCLRLHSEYRTKEETEWMNANGCEIAVIRFSEISSG